MKKVIYAVIAAVMFFSAAPALTFAHGGSGNSGSGNMNHMRFDDHRFDDRRFDDHNRFKKDPFRNFRNTDIRNNIRVFNKVIDSNNVRIRNIIRVVNRF